MLVKMKKFEQVCYDYCKRFKKNWEFYCISSDSWLNGYYHGLKQSQTDNEIVEVEFKDGEHQIGARFSDREQDNG